MNKKIGLGLQYLTALALLGSAAAKFFAPPAPEMNAFPHLIEAIPYIGALEILVVLLWVIPQTKKAGFYLVCSYLGGAICAHVFIGEGMIFPAIFLALGWVAMYLEDKNMSGPLAK
jgi:hypothetical protein